MMSRNNSGVFFILLKNLLIQYFPRAGIVQMWYCIYFYILHLFERQIFLTFNFLTLNIWYRIFSLLIFKSSTMLSYKMIRIRNIITRIFRNPDSVWKCGAIFVARMIEDPGTPYYQICLLVSTLQPNPCFTKWCTHTFRNDVLCKLLADTGSQYYEITYNYEMKWCTLRNEMIYD